MEGSSMQIRQYTHKIIAAIFLFFAMLLIISSVSGQQPFIPNGAHFPNPGGTSQTYSTAGRALNQLDLFFKSSAPTGARAPHAINPLTACPSQRPMSSSGSC
jgi:hypothetical protein